MAEAIAATFCTQEVLPPIYIAPSNSISREESDVSTTTKPLTRVAELFHNAPSNATTNVAPIRDYFIPCSSIGVSQEETDACTGSKTIGNAAETTSIPPSPVTVAMVYSVAATGSIC